MRLVEFVQHSLVSLPIASVFRLSECKFTRQHCVRAPSIFKHPARRDRAKPLDSLFSGLQLSPELQASRRWLNHRFADRLSDRDSRRPLFDDPFAGICWVWASKNGSIWLENE